MSDELNLSDMSWCKKTIESLRAKVTELDRIASELQDTCHKQAQKLTTSQARVAELEVRLRQQAEASASVLNKKQEQLAACEKDRACLQSALDQANRNRESVDALKNQLATSQHYAQQLREALEWYSDIGLGFENRYRAREALSLPHDTSALNQLKAGYELQIKTLREALEEIAAFSGRMSPNRILAKEALDSLSHDTTSTSTPELK